MDQYTGPINEMKPITLKQLREAELKHMTLNEFLDSLGAIALSIDLSEK